jgi:hypothetical protein
MENLSKANDCIRRLALLLVALAALVPVVAQTNHSRSSEQSHFSAEDEGVEKPVEIPDDVLTILRQDRLVRNVLRSQETPTERPPQSWFSASTIHLSNSGGSDLIVVAEGPLAGANVDAFWVFRDTANGHELVLMAPAHDLVIRKTTWMGYREIELMSATAVQWSDVLLRWNGEKYVSFREESGQNK